MSSLNPAAARQTYRPEIDGLRALSVCLIIATHLNLPFAAGGFIGVDVFFVISGYVIHKSLFQEIDENRFSLLQFYKRRLHRIVPSLTVTVFCTLVVGLLVLSPDKLKDVSVSALAALAFVPNIHFNDTISYFATEAKDMPLLHTWSLGVEEQFYILVPIIFLLSKKSGTFLSAKQNIALVSLVSFVWCLYETNADPQRAFYLPMSRLWEIGVGGILASTEDRWIDNKFLGKVGAPVGLLLICASLFLINEDTPFPSLWACLPVAGAALVLSSSGKSLACNYLRAPSAVWVGKLSYTLYLVHWPIIVFWRQFGVPFGNFWLVAVLATIVCSSYLISKLVEQPLRHSLHPKPQFTQGILLGTILCAVFASSIVVLEGLPQRLTDKTLAAIDGFEHAEQERIKCAPLLEGKSMPCHYGEAKQHQMIIFGDSHAGSIAPELAANLINNGSLMGVTLFSTIRCPPLLDVEIVGPNTTQCRELTSNHLSNALKLQPNVVVLIARWANFESEFPSMSEGKHPAKLRLGNESEPFVGLNTALQGTIQAFTQLGIRVVVVGPIPEVGFHVPDAIFKSIWLESEAPLNPVATFYRRQRKVLQSLEALGAIDHVSVFYPHKIFCDNDECKIIENGAPLYIDDDHLSASGSKLLANELSRLVLSK